MRGTDLPAHHRAWTWQSGRDPHGLVLAKQPVAAPGPGEVLVRNAVIGLNPVDWKVLGSTSWQPGKVPGCDGAGTVIAVGTDVPEAWLGQRVGYHTWLGGPGSFAEITPVAARALLPVPAGLDMDLAASMPCPALTAWLALSKLPGGGGSLLVAGAGGGVGGYLVQLALEARWNVTAQCHPRHHARLAAYGAEVLPWNANLPQAAYTAAVDLRGPEPAAGLFPHLRANGHLVCVQGRVPGWGDAAFERCISLHEVALGALHVHGDVADWHGLRHAGAMIFDGLLTGRLVPEPTVATDFECLPAHLRALRDRDFSGKALIRA
ncbi:alcohol dehydrogenase catalytic domain-containing protein [Mangrovicoccus sp. HB161399]|uniref:alcohol dehydrogenase catalytic domain-containing protein n=1 Tax=Mangrovicoccus sp. HB161399 TaxID=2720392 RepID=UPI0015544EE1|nr:alcohol dehydrogenase catalytic domain-containing protein [Mangrovicoccus sp. HB161399]